MNSLVELIKSNKQNIKNLYLLNQKYTITLKEYYSKIGAYEGMNTMYFNDRFKVFLNHILKNSYVGFGYSQEWFNLYYKGIVQSISNQIDRLQFCISNRIEQYQ